MQKAFEHFIEKLFSCFDLKISRISTQSVPSVFFEVDPEFNQLYELAQEKTQMSSTDNILRRQRQYTLVKLLQESQNIINQGDVAECGCWRGLSSYQIAENLKKMQFNQIYYIFDSFEGLSEFDNEDRKGVLVNENEENCRRSQFACSLDIVKENLKEFDFIEYKKGWIPERFDEVSDMKFSFVHIDVDMYQPIRDSLEFFYPRLISGGIIVLDDYGCLNFPGAKKAVDAYLMDKSCFFLPLPSGAAFIVKQNY